MSNTLPTNATISILPRNRAIQPTARLRVQLVVPSGAMERISGTGNIITGTCTTTPARCTAATTR